MEWKLHNPDLAALVSTDADTDMVASFRDVPLYVARGTEDIGYLEGKRVLDYGCGNGLTALGIAMFHQPELVLGVDVGPPGRRVPGLLSRLTGSETAPANLQFRQIARVDDLGDEYFDFALSWSAFHHIEREFLDRAVAQIYGALRVGSRVLVQISPLYHSAHGASLSRYGLGRWEHLTLSNDAIRDRIFSHEQSSIEEKGSAWEFFQSLTKITAPELVRVFENTGFYRARYFEALDDDEPPEDLLRNYAKGDLKRSQVLIVLVKA